MAVAQSSATDEEIPSSASGEVEAAPWSGWWWPSFEGVGPTLFAFNGPLDKYDRYVAATSGADPATRTWERQSLIHARVAALNLLAFNAAANSIQA